MDDFILNTLNNLAHNASYFTKIMFLIVHNELVKGGVIIAILWYLWFNKNKSTQSREKVIITLLGSIIAVAVGRTLANILPYRARPILNSEFHFTYQIDDISWLNVMSSFPSDHAVLFFSLATGIFLISKKWGMLSLAYVFFIICFPRIYLGFHYPTDILAGAAIGIFIMCLLSILKIFRKVSQKIFTLSNKLPGIFYACFFILSYQIATLFNESREIISSLLELIK